MLFKKLFGINNFTLYKSFSTLYDQYATLGFEKQLVFAEKVENKDWNIDLNAGTITFNNELSYPVQLLGSFSFAEKMWVWSWANQATKIPRKLLETAKEFRAYGKKRKIGELTRGSLKLAMTDIHSFGLVALGMFGGDGYYVGNFGEGALLVTIREPKSPAALSEEEEHLRILSVYPQFIAMFEIKAQQKVLKNYLSAKKYKFTEETDTHLIARKNGREIIGIFDEKGVLLQLKG
ncbi:DUF6882 domain-containing protein [Caviibacterium pharyngocola]|uniref:Uncharacterized protein n=1 Tax=Caviibacterium pharyngocola TaxID=28159 RepID=A0A2M8RXH3_9PAST|nr:DUF6882 domain-containing protein [Caviibacterium pharyngocola]PJG83578.1 hypothetical protein CVP04_02775 [Caviibacterium pharyngocola]